MLARVQYETDLGHLGTNDIKARLLDSLAGQDEHRLSEKLAFFEAQLQPYFAELTRRNPIPRAEDQVAAVMGVWTPIWSTIPFHDVLPGRVRSQSYQVFRGDGYYANMAHHAPGHQIAVLDKLAPMLPAWNLMVVQRFDICDGKWLIKNIGVEVARGRRDKGLGIDDAERWFAAVLDEKLDRFDQKSGHLGKPDLSGLDAAAAKKLEKTFLATPTMENLYIDDDLRVIKSQRESRQRPSYTVGVRRR
jgi:hypothetical protein